MIDLHCHILPGIDDGAASIEDSVAMARAAAEDGISLIIATPYVNGAFMPGAAEIAARVREVNDALAAARIPVVVSPGAEIGVTELGALSEQELRGLTLGASTTLLVESPYTPTAPFLEGIIFDAQAAGFRILLAHPERSPVFHRDMGRLEALIGRGVLVSLSAGSLAEDAGRTPNRFARDPRVAPGRDQRDAERDHAERRDRGREQAQRPGRALELGPEGEVEQRPGEGRKAHRQRQQPGEDQLDRAPERAVDGRLGVALQVDVHRREGAHERVREDEGRLEDPVRGAVEADRDLGGHRRQHHRVDAKQDHHEDVLGGERQARARVPAPAAAVGRPARRADRARHERDAEREPGRGADQITGRDRDHAEAPSSAAMPSAAAITRCAIAVIAIGPPDSCAVRTPNTVRPSPSITKAAVRT